MMYVSFAWTTEAYLAGRKTETRRFWSDDYAEKFWRVTQANNMIFGACDKSFRFGGKKIGLNRLLEKPYKQKLRHVTDADEKAEGGLWGNAENFIEAMGGEEKEPYVVKFEKLATEEQSTQRNLFDSIIKKGG